MKSIGIIPARGGSKGIPLKNIKELKGKPLIAYTIEASLGSDLDKVIVSTDSSDIARVAKGYGVEVVIRPRELAADDTPTLPVLLHALTCVQNSSAYSAIVTLQPTSPFRTSDHINEALELFNTDDSVDSLVSVVKIAHNMVPESIMKERDGYLENYITTNKEVLRRQDKATYFARNGAAVYITRRDRINEFIFGGRILPYEMSMLESIDIDSAEDWTLAVALMNSRDIG